jgi:hypothetical protein
MSAQFRTMEVLYDFLSKVTIVSNEQLVFVSQDAIRECIMLHGIWGQGKLCISSLHL